MGSSNLVLIGFMGTGKSTVGYRCAQLLGYKFHDTDTLIVERAGLSIPQIFEREGEEGFRVRERAVVAELADKTRQVIATGGGAILDTESAHRLRAAGCVAALRARPDTVLHRVGDVRSRPLLASAPDPAERVASLIAERFPKYSEHALRSFDTDDRTPSQIAAEIVRWYSEWLREPINIEVSLGDCGYSILVQEGLLADGTAVEHISSLAGGGRVCIVTHPELYGFYAERIEAGLRSREISVSTVMIPAGERHKTLKTVARLYDAFLEARLDRKGLVVAIGGGVLGDITGFASASYLRGVRIVQVPTTLLSQVDSSVGGKTGVDLPGGKNLVGAFHQPSLVLIDPATLSTLPARELRSGLAEVIKYGIIYDASFFEEVATGVPEMLRRIREPLLHAIVRSCQIKADVVGQDETEQGLRAILNFGHTVGHALESVTQYRRYKHGEAISIGMVSAALVGEQLGVTPPSVTRAIRRTLDDARLPVMFPEDIETDRILDAAQRDKKTDGGRLRFVLARAMGDVYVHNDVPATAIVEALQRQRQGDPYNE